MTRAIGVEVSCPFTPGMLKKVAHAGSRSASFAAATKDLDALAEVTVSRERVERWTERVGDERVDEVDTAAAQYEALPLPARRENPSDQVPQVACVMMDGGRIQIRDRAAEPEPAKGYWRESLVGCCVSMVSEEHTEDPCPAIPKTFVDPQRMSDLSREIKGFSARPETTAESPEDSPDDRPAKPQVLVRSVTATRAGIDTLGRRLVADAHRRGFSAAKRKALVADGAATNWSVHRKHFSGYTAILDFTHAVCYVWAAAMAGRSSPEAWSDYIGWAQLLWSGQVDRLIAAIEIRQQQLGPPSDGDETSPAALVARTLVYLTNQRTRMKYDEYRKAGLPITSSHIESTVKQINRRVKGSEKFWDQGAEPMLQLAADHVSETSDFDHFWTSRHRKLKSMRCYQSAA
ncbi:MAG: hypothetical protein ACC645_24225 [Pirellulales bacterium]